MAEPIIPSVGQAPKPFWVEAVEQAGPDDDVYVYKPGSEARGTVKKRDLANLPLGWDLEPPELTRDARLNKEASGQKFRTFIEGAGSTLSLGGTDILVGGVLDDKEYKARQRENSGTRMLGQVGGMVLGAYAPFTPAGAALGAGKAVGGSVSRLGFKGAAGRILPALAREGTENAIFGAAEGAAQTYLSDNPNASEALLGNMTSGALLGGGLGVGVGLGGQLVGESLRVGRNYFKQGVRNAEVGAARELELGRAASRPPNLDPHARKVAEWDLKRAEGDLTEKAQASNAARAAAEGDLATSNESLKWFKGDYENLDVLSGSALRRIEKLGPEASVEQLAAHEELMQARAATRDYFEGQGVYRRSTAIDPKSIDLAPEKKVKRINEWMGDDANLARVVDNPDLPDMLTRQEAALERAKSVLDGPPEGGVPVTKKSKRVREVSIEGDESSLPFDEQVNRAAARVGPEGVFGDRKVFIADVYDQMPAATRGTLDEFKARVNAERRAGTLSLTRADLVQAMPEDRVARSAINDPTGADYHFVAYDNLAEMRTRYGKPGVRTVEEEFDELVKPGSKPWQPFKVQRDVFQKVAGYDDVMLRATAGVDSAELQAAYQRVQELEKLVATGKLNDVQAIEFARGTVAAAEKAGIDASWPTVLKAAEEAGYDAAALSSAGPEFRALFSAKYAREAAKRALAAKAGKEVAGRGLGGTALGAGIGWGVDWALGGALGPLMAGVGGGLIGRFMKGTVMGMKRQLARNIGKTGRGLAAGVDSFLGAAEKAVRSPAIPRTAVQVLQSARYGRQDEDVKYKGTALQKAYQARAGELSQSAASPGSTKAAINESLIGVRITDPTLADQLGDLAIKRMEYLLKTMPKVQFPPNPFSKAVHLPSDAEIAKWARCAQIADHPEAIFDHMHDGTLTPEHVEALKAVYPGLYREIQMDIVSQAASIQASLGWEKRVTLSTLFEAPTDDILRPELVGILQAGYAEKGTEPNKPQPPSKSTNNTPTKAQQLSG